MKLNVPRVVKGWGLNRTVALPQTNFKENNIGSGRKYAIESHDSNWKDAFSAFGLVPYCVEPRYQIFTGIHYLTGSYTHIHTDDAPDGYVHTRCNVILEKPQIGGDPIIDYKVIPVEIGDLWLVFSSLENHGSTPISQPRRVIKSFGALVSYDQIQKLIEKEPT